MTKLVLVAVPAVVAIIVAVLLVSGGGTVLEGWIILSRLCSDTAQAAIMDAGDAIDRPSATPAGLAASNNKFTMDFYRHVSGDENVLFSPAGIYLAYSALYEGAGFEAAGELEEVFGFEPDLESRYVGTASFMSALKPVSYYPWAILMANGFWMPDDAPSVHDAYAYTNRALYWGTIGHVPSGESGSEIINDWVKKQMSGSGFWSEKTAKQLSGRITNFLDPLDADASMVVASAASFQTSWAVQFPPENTRRADFDTGNGGTVTVDMVQTTATLRYADTGSEQVLQMPYDGRFNRNYCEWIYDKNGTPGGDFCNDLTAPLGQLPAGYFKNSDISDTCSLMGDLNLALGNSWSIPSMAEPAFAQYIHWPPIPDDKWLSMIIVLPPLGNDGMRSLEERLSAELFGEWRDQLRYAKVDVILPKFKSGGQYDLIPILEGLGVKKVGEAGSLPGISKDLYMSEAIHQADVQVYEGHGKVPITRPDPQVEVPAQEHPHSFVADRPFLYFIQDTQSGAIIFMGKVTDPTA